MPLLFQVDRETHNFMAARFSADNTATASIKSANVWGVPNIPHMTHYRVEMV